MLNFFMLKNSRMEVIHSTNIVFNNGGRSGRESNDEVETFKMSKPFSKMKSPLGSKLPKPAKSPWDGLSGMTPIKGHPIETPTRLPGPPVLPTPLSFTESPKLGDTPTKEQETSAFGMYDLPSPKEQKWISPIDSGSSIGIPKWMTLESPLSVSPSKINPKIRAMYNGSRRDFEETSDFTLNPDPVPYQPSNFMSSTMLKKVPVQRRHLDTFDLASSPSKRGVILHTDRYQWDLARALDGMSQRERLQAELEYMERLRGIKRRREVLPHRAQLDLLMGGKKVEFKERFEIQREIQKLRSLILPQNARDLFHGRGFRLPEEHNSVHPRRPLPVDIDNEELQDASDLFPSSKFTFDPETGRAKPKWHKQSVMDASVFPKINNKGYLLGHGQPVILSKEKRTVASLKARLHIPTKNFRVRKGEPIAVQTPNPFTPRDDDTWTPYVTRQHTMISPVTRPNTRSPHGHPYSPKKRPKIYSRESTDSMFVPSSRGLVLSPRGYGTGLSPRGSTRPAYLQRAKTNFVPQKQGTRTYTAMPDHKTRERPLAATAPVVKEAQRDIKIPVSSREDTDLLLDSQPKPPPPTANKKPELEEDIVIQEVLDNRDSQSVHSPDKETRSLLSRQSTHHQSTTSPVKAPTPNPLKGSELPGALSEEEQNKLKQTFKRLDTDSDGHLLFSQLQSQLPKQFSQTQEKFIKLVYDITSACTFFGVDEFMTMSYLTNTVTSLSGAALEAYDHIDFYTLREIILQYVELFQSVDRSHKGKISLNSLQDILSAAIVTDLKEDPHKWGHIVDVLAPSETGQITKIEFLAHIPYFQTLVHK